MYSSKGVSSTLAFFAIGAVAIVVILLYIHDSAEAGEKIFDKEMCRKNVEAHTLGLALSGRQFESRIDCPTSYGLLEADQSANKKIAESLRNCWYSFLEGEKPLFNDEHVFCHPCTVFSFKEKDKQLTGLWNELKNKMPNSDDTYIEYLSPKMSEGALAVDELIAARTNLEKQQGDNLRRASINTSKNYATMVVFANGRDEMADFWNYVTTPGPTKGHALAFVGAVGGSATVGLAALSLMGFGVLSNPVGWVVGAAGVAAIGAGAGEIIGYSLSPAAAPEGVAAPLFIEYNEESLRALNCHYEPIPINSL